MPFCKNCGSQVDGSFCAKCGTPQAAAPPPAAPAYTPPPPQPPPAQPYAQPGYAAPAQPAPAAAGMSDNVAALLCYLVGLVTGILFLVLEPYNKSKFVRFHAFQSIFANVAWIAIWIVVSIFSSVLFAVLPWGVFSLLHLLFWLVWMVVGLGFFVLWLFLMLQAYQGKKFMLPIIGALADKQA